MEQWNEIRHKVLVEKVSKRQIRRDYRIGSETLDKILANAEPPGYRQRSPRAKPKLGEFIGIIDQILFDDRDAPVKQRHTAKRIFERLRDEHGYEGSSSQVRAAVAELRWSGLGTMLLASAGVAGAVVVVVVARGVGGSCLFFVTAPAGATPATSASTPAQRSPAARAW